MKRLIAALAPLALLAVGLAPTRAEAGFPKYLDFQTCWSGVCTGLNNTWTLRADGTFTDQFGSTGVWFFANQYPGVWMYTFDWFLLYDNGSTQYIGDLDGSRALVGDAITYNFFYYPYPTIISGPWCTEPVPATGDCP